jgi:16S rRNA (guanine527-N7)-methyltransferase
MEREGIAQGISEATSRFILKIGMTIDESSLERLGLYAEELAKWNKAYNLVGRKLGSQGIVDLIVDALTPLSIKGLLGEKKDVLDLGTGAGLPGIPLFLAAGPFPLTLVEAQRKKITFLRHIQRKLELQGVRIFPGRIEEIARSEDEMSRYDVVLARAVADPIRLMKQARVMLSQGGKIVEFVGKNDAERIRKSGAELQEKAGLKVEAMKSMQRYIGKEHYLAVVMKQD